MQMLTVGSPATCQCDTTDTRKLSKLRYHITIYNNNQKKKCIKKTRSYHRQ